MSIAPNDGTEELIEMACLQLMQLERRKRQMDQEGDAPRTAAKRARIDPKENDRPHPQSREGT